MKKGIMKKGIVLFLVIMTMASCDTIDPFDCSYIVINNKSSHDVMALFDFRNDTTSMDSWIIRQGNESGYIQFDASDFVSYSFVLRDLNNQDTLYIHESSPFVKNDTGYNVDDFAGSYVPGKNNLLLFELTLTDELFADWQAKHRDSEQAAIQ
ncbi:MAG: hypothetical protein ACI3Z7_00760 [Candidatus Aphodosoma sp.]